MNKLFMVFVCWATGVASLLLASDSILFAQESKPASPQSSRRADKLMIQPVENVPELRFQVPASDVQARKLKIAAPKVVQWKSGASWHEPLIFEEAELERNGATRPEASQNVISGFRFFSKAAVYPFYLFRNSGRRLLRRSP